jgi:hypothetical protein
MAKPDVFAWSSFGRVTSKGSSCYGWERAANVAVVVRCFSPVSCWRRAVYAECIKRTDGWHAKRSLLMKGILPTWQRKVENAVIILKSKRLELSPVPWIGAVKYSLEFWQHIFNFQLRNPATTYCIV